MPTLPPVDVAAELAHDALAALPRRLAHTSQVAANADTLGRRLGLHPGNAHRLTAAAWLHDVGYGPEAAGASGATGFHPIDGARSLRRHGWPTSVVDLVAWHTTAPEEARIRGLLDTLRREFHRPDSMLADLLAYADLTASPDGQPVGMADRIAEICQRYPAEHPAHRAMLAARPRLDAIAAQIASGSDSAPTRDEARTGPDPGAS